MYLCSLDAESEKRNTSDIMCENEGIRRQKTIPWDFHQVGWVGVEGWVEKIERRGPRKKFGGRPLESQKARVGFSWQSVRFMYLKVTLHTW